MSTGGGVVENGRQERQQVVNVQNNSDSAMDDLFSVINNPQKSISSFRQKNLPKSFFTPPDPNRSSRENLLQDQQNFGVSGGSAGHPGLLPNHARSRSSPAQLPNSLSVPTPTPNHRPQHSVDYAEEMQLPAEWERNPRYHLTNPNPQNSLGQWSNNTNTSQGQQKSLSSGNLVDVSSVAAGATSPSSSSHGPSPATSLQNLTLVPHFNYVHLPQGWDISMTADHEIYYINHNSKSTSWYHPLLPQQQHRTSPMKLSQLPPSQQQAILQMQAQQQQQQAAMQQQQLSPPQQHPTPPQRCSPALSLSPSAAPPAPPSTSPAPVSQGNNSEQQIYRELLRLQQERERLQRQQEDIARKELLLHSNFGRGQQVSPPSSSGNNNNNATTVNNNTNNALTAAAQQQQSQLGVIEETPVAVIHNSVAFKESLLKDLMSPAASTTSTTSSENNVVPMSTSLQAMQTSSGIDPFLSQPSNPTVESHARQNSADSGLGGMGTNYSLPRTPDDFLRNVEEMDSTSNDGVQKLHKQNITPDFNMVIDSLGDGDSSAMGDDLVSSLQDDVLNADILNDMDIQKDFLTHTHTWL